MRNAPLYTNHEYKENIVHEIGSRPYSLHKTIVKEEESLALYQHWHEEIEIFYLEQGEIDIIVEDHCYHLHAGEAVVIPPNLFHMAKKQTQEVCCFYAFVFSPLLFTGLLAGPSYSRFVQPLKHNGLAYLCKFTPEISWQKELLALLAKILKFYRRQDIDNWELELHGLLYQLWNLYYNNHMAAISLSSNYSKLYNRLKPSITYIHQNYAANMTLAQLAAQSRLCSGTFCRYFKELTGMTPFSYLNRCRIRGCCEALLHTELTVTQIANQYGFNNISYFNRLFLQYVKCKPSEYRKKSTTT